MAGMFYSLQEAAEKLNKTEEEVKEIARKGRLREFRDGPNLLFKVDEVEALMSDTSIMPPQVPSAPSEPEPVVPVEPEPVVPVEQEPAVPFEPEPVVPVEQEPAIPLEPEPVVPVEQEPAVPFEPEPVVPVEQKPAVPLEPEPVVPVEQKPAVPFEPEPVVPVEPEPVVPVEPEPAVPVEPEPAVPVAQEPAVPPQPEEEEISLAPESAEAPASELTSADTALAGEGISVLDEADRDYQVTEDTMAETKAVPSEASLEEIEEDVSLDSFGSGSGLLDLSLQADDTSLGGILDEIYTPETGEGKEAAEPGSAIEMAVEAEQMLTEGEFAAPQRAPEVTAMARAYIEHEPDTQSNTLGMLLFLPLLAIIYTAIVAVAGFNNIMPAILQKIQGYIWYIMIGAAVAAIVIIAVAFMLGSKGPKAAKRPKAKRAKKTRKSAPKNATT